jgi:lysophospholipase L1-like esterase
MITSACVRRVALGAALAGLAATAAAQDFSRYVSVGDSLAAGYVNGSLVETHQRFSVPAHIARQAGAASFELPRISVPGIPGELQLVSLIPTQILPKPGLGAPLNLGLARPYNNLAVPGHTSIDALQARTGSALTDLILRGLGTQVEQALALNPTFITLWIGNNDVLGAAIAGRAIDGVTMTPTEVFRLVYAQIVASLKASGARIVAANLPDVTAIPFVSTIAPVVPNPATGRPLIVNGQTVPLLGPLGPLPPEAKVTLAASPLLAQGIGVPVALGGQARIEGLQCLGCLPDEVILDPSEQAFIRDHVRVNNQSIADICGAAAIPVVDINALFNQAQPDSGGFNIGGVTVTSGFLTGGVIGYDGVHPTDLGNALAANEWIRVINESGGSLPLVDLAPFLGVSASARRAGPVEFSLEAWQQLLEVFPRLDR